MALPPNIANRVTELSKLIGQHHALLVTTHHTELDTDESFKVELGVDDDTGFLNVDFKQVADFCTTNQIQYSWVTYGGNAQIKFEDCENLNFFLAPLNSGRDTLPPKSLTLTLTNCNGEVDPEVMLKVPMGSGFRLKLLSVDNKRNSIMLSSTCVIENVSLNGNVQFKNGFCYFYGTEMFYADFDVIKRAKQSGVRIPNTPRYTTVSNNVAASSHDANSITSLVNALFDLNLIATRNLAIQINSSNESIDNNGNDGIEFTHGFHLLDIFDVFIHNNPKVIPESIEINDVGFNPQFYHTRHDFDLYSNITNNHRKGMRSFVKFLTLWKQGKLSPVKAKVMLAKELGQQDNGHMIKPKTEVFHNE